MAHHAVGGLRISRITRHESRSAYANLHPAKNGKTARQLLGEQLDLLDNQMKEIVEDIHRDDAQKLVIHGRFLEDKFRDADLLFGLNQRQPAPVSAR